MIQASNGRMYGSNNVINQFQNNRQQQNASINPYQRDINRTGMREATGLDRFFANQYNLSEEISNLSGFNEKWQQVHEDWDKGDYDRLPVDVLSAVPNFVASVPIGMVSGVVGAPSKVYEAVTGNPILEEQDGWMPDYELTPEQRIATGVDALIDVGGAAIGGSGRLLRAGANALKGTRAGELFRPGTLAFDMTEEGVEEFTQSYLGEVRGTQETHGLEAIDDGSFGRALESGALGAAGGAVFHGIGKLISNATESDQDRIQEQLSQRDPSSVEDNKPLLDPFTVQKSQFNDSNNSWFFDNELVEFSHNAQLDGRKLNGTHTATLTSLGGRADMLGVNDAFDSGAQLVEALYRDGYTPENDEETNLSSREEIIRAYHFDADPDALKSLNEAIVARDDEKILRLLQTQIDRSLDPNDVEVPPIYAVIAKAPETNYGPFKVRITGLVGGTNSVALSPVLVTAMNADYDGDLGALTYNQAQRDNSRFLSEAMVDHERGTNAYGSSKIKWFDYGYFKYLFRAGNNVDHNGDIYTALVNQMQDVNKVDLGPLGVNHEVLLKLIENLRAAFDDYYKSEDPKIRENKDAFDKKVSEAFMTYSKDVLNNLGENANKEIAANLVSETHRALYQIANINSFYIKNTTEESQDTLKAIAEVVDIGNQNSAGRRQNTAAYIHYFFGMCRRLLSGVKDNEVFRTNSMPIYSTKGDQAMELYGINLAQLQDKDWFNGILLTSLSMVKTGESAQVLSERALVERIYEKTFGGLRGPLPPDKISSMLSFDEKGNLDMKNSSFVWTIKEVMKEYNEALKTIQNDKFSIKFKDAFKEKHPNELTEEQVFSYLVKIIGEEEITTIFPISEDIESGRSEQRYALKGMTFNRFFERSRRETPTNLFLIEDNNIIKIMQKMQHFYNNRYKKYSTSVNNMIENLIGSVNNVKELMVSEKAREADADAILLDAVAIQCQLDQILGLQTASKLGFGDVRNLFDLSPLGVDYKGTDFSKGVSIRKVGDVLLTGTPDQVKGVIFTCNMAVEYYQAIVELNAVRNGNLSFEEKKRALQTALALISSSARKSVLHYTIYNSFASGLKSTDSRVAPYAFDEETNTYKWNDSMTEAEFDEYIENDGLRAATILLDLVTAIRPDVNFAEGSDSIVNLIKQFASNGMISQEILENEDFLVDSFVNDWTSLDDVGFATRVKKANRYANSQEYKTRQKLRREAEQLKTIAENNKAGFKLWAKYHSQQVSVRFATDFIGLHVYRCTEMGRERAEKAQNNDAQMLAYQITSDVNSSPIEPFIETLTKGMDPCSFTSVNSFWSNREAVVNILLDDELEYTIMVNGSPTALTRKTLCEMYGVSTEQKDETTIICDLLIAQPKFVEYFQDVIIEPGKNPVTGETKVNHRTTGSLVESFNDFSSTVYVGTGKEIEKGRQAVKAQLVRDGDIMKIIVPLMSHNTIRGTRLSAFQKEANDILDYIADRIILSNLTMGEEGSIYDSVLDNMKSAIFDLAQVFRTNEIGGSKYNELSMRDKINDQIDNTLFMTFGSIVKSSTDVQTALDLFAKQKAGSIEDQTNLAKEQLEYFNWIFEVESFMRRISISELDKGLADKGYVKQIASYFGNDLFDSVDLKMYSQKLAEDDLSANGGSVEFNGTTYNNTDELAMAYLKSFEENMEKTNSGKLTVLYSQVDGNVESIFNELSRKIEEVTSLNIEEKVLDLAETIRFKIFNDTDNIGDLCIELRRILNTALKEKPEDAKKMMLRDVSFLYIRTDLQAKFRTDAFLSHWLNFDIIEQQIEIQRAFMDLAEKQEVKKAIDDWKNILGIENQARDNFRQDEITGQLTDNISEFERFYHMNTSDALQLEISKIAVDLYANPNVAIDTGVNGQVIKQVAILGLLKPVEGESLCSAAISSREKQNPTGGSIEETFNDVLKNVSEEDEDIFKEEINSARFYVKYIEDGTVIHKRITMNDVEKSNGQYRFTDDFLAKYKNPEKKNVQFIDRLECTDGYACPDHYFDIGHVLSTIIKNAAEARLLKIKKTAVTIHDIIRKSREAADAVQNRTIILTPDIKVMDEIKKLQYEYFKQTGIRNEDIGPVSATEKRQLTNFCSSFVKVKYKAVDQETGETKEIYRLMSLSRFQEELEALRAVNATVTLAPMSPIAISNAMLHNVYKKQLDFTPEENADGEGNGYAKFVRRAAVDFLKTYDVDLLDGKSDLKVAFDRTRLQKKKGIFTADQNIIDPSMARFLDYISPLANTNSRTISIEAMPFETSNQSKTMRVELPQPGGIKISKIFGSVDPNSRNSSIISAYEMLGNNNTIYSGTSVVFENCGAQHIELLSRALSTRNIESVLIKINSDLARIFESQYLGTFSITNIDGTEYIQLSPEDLKAESFIVDLFDDLDLDMTTYTISSKDARHALAFIENDSKGGKFQLPLGDSMIGFFDDVASNLLYNTEYTEINVPLSTYLQSGWEKSVVENFDDYTGWSQDEIKNSIEGSIDIEALDELGISHNYRRDSIVSEVVKYIYNCANHPNTNEYGQNKIACLVQYFDENDRKIKIIPIYATGPIPLRGFGINNAQIDNFGNLTYRLYGRIDYKDPDAIAKMYFSDQSRKGIAAFLTGTSSSKLDSNGARISGVYDKEAMSKSLIGDQLRRSNALKLHTLVINEANIDDNKYGVIDNFDKFKKLVRSKEARARLEEPKYFADFLDRYINGEFGDHIFYEDYVALENILKIVLTNAYVFHYPLEDVISPKILKFSPYISQLYTNMSTDEMLTYFNWIDPTGCPSSSKIVFKEGEENEKYRIYGDLKVVVNGHAYQCIVSIPKFSSPNSMSSAISTEGTFGTTRNEMALLSRGTGACDLKQALDDMWAFSANAGFSLDQMVLESDDAKIRRDLGIKIASKGYYPSLSQYLDALDLSTTAQTNARFFDSALTDKWNRLYDLRYDIIKPLQVFKYDNETGKEVPIDKSTIESYESTLERFAGKRIKWFYIGRIIAARLAINPNNETGFYHLNKTDFDREFDLVCEAYRNGTIPMLVGNNKTTRFTRMESGSKRFNIPLLEKQTLETIYYGTSLSRRKEFSTFDKFLKACDKATDEAIEVINSDLNNANPKEKKAKTALLDLADFMRIDNGLHPEFDWCGSTMRQHWSDITSETYKLTMKLLGDTQRIESIEAAKRASKAYGERMKAAMESLDKTNQIIDETDSDYARNHKIIRHKSKDAAYFGKAMDMAVDLVRFNSMILNIPVMLSNALAKEIDGRTQLLLLQWADKGITTPISASKRIKIDESTIQSVSKMKEVADVLDAARSAYFQGLMTEFQNELSSSDDKQAVIKKWKENRSAFPGVMGKAFSATMRIGTAADLCKNVRTEIFLRRFAQMAGELNVQGIDADYLNMNLLEHPMETIVSLFSMENTAAIANRAFNNALKGDMAEQTWVSIMFDDIAKRHKMFNFLTTTCCTKFFMASVNWTNKILQFIAPMSTFNYAINDYMAKHGDEISDRTNGLISKNVSFQAQNSQLYSSIGEALKMDLMHMTIPAIACVLALSAFYEPPEDDDKWQNVDEWLICKERVGGQWWLKDLLGFGVPLACWWKSVLLGRPCADLVTKSLMESLWSNPFIKTGNFILDVLDPDAMIGMNGEDYYADFPGGAPTGLEYMMGSLGAFSLSYVGQFITPAILKDIARTMPQYETSSNRIYEESLTGPLTNDGEYGDTRYTTFFDAQIRKVTKNNPILGIMMNALPTNSSTSYLGWQMPRVYFIDQDQMSFANTYSIYDESGNLKSDEEIEALCGDLVYTLYTYDDMEALYHAGWYLNYDTKAAVSRFLYDWRQSIYDSHNAYCEETGGFDYYVMGNGDFNAGRLAYEQYQSSYYEALNTVTNLYNKLWSSELNQGLQYYNRINTTYDTDANGNVYATGYREGLGGLLNPLTGAPLESGYENDWASISAVTGKPMMETDEYGNVIGMRALVPYRVEPSEKPDFDSWGNKDNEGNSKTSGNTSRSYSNGSYGTSSRSGYRGYGSGGSGGSSGVRVYSNPQRVNADRPTVSDPVRGNYGPDFDYLRPGFTTKGSREAYRREDY